MPQAVRFRDRIMWRLIFFSTQSLMKLKHSLEWTAKSFTHPRHAGRMLSA